MWLFSPSSSAADGADRPELNGASSSAQMQDEESTTIIAGARQKSYSAVHADHGAGPSERSSSAYCADDDDGATATNGAHGPITCDASPRAPMGNGAAFPSNDTAMRANGGTGGKSRRGLIYFRSIKPSDRRIIQTLHEEWFPVDYKDDFFDTLCGCEGDVGEGEKNNGTDGISGSCGAVGDGDGSSRKRRLLPGINQPLYCTVACFRELSDAEYDERLRREREREEREASWSFWSSGGDKLSRGEHGGFGLEDYDDEDCILWEVDQPEQSAMERDNRNGVEGQGSGSSSQLQEGSPMANGVATCKPCSYAATDPPENDDVIESGDSVFSIHHRRERERMKQFYSNGFRFDKVDDNSNMSVDNGVASQHTAHAPSSRNGAERDIDMPAYNDDGEQIIGCIVGTFLPSNMPARKHRSTLHERIPRDETASLLVPDCDRHSKMFYIMTLGTSREFRRCGLGSVLVNRVVDAIEEREPECGALYLHVITYNDGAIRLYERLGFMRVKEIKGK